MIFLRYLCYDDMLLLFLLLHLLIVMFVLLFAY